MAGPRADIAALAMGHRLTLIVAGAGWGKSSVLRALVAAAPSIEVRRPGSGWTPFGLAHALVDAIATHTHSDPEEPLPPYQTADSPDRSEQIAALAAHVCALATSLVDADTVVVLDDVDIADDDPLLQFLDPLIRGLPPPLHLVVACRTQPNLRIARLRAAGEVAHVGPEELAMTTADIDRLGLEPAARAAVLDVANATRGWPIAVHLAAEVSRRSGPMDRGALIEQLLAPDAILFDYLADDVLANLTDAERELLVLAASVPELSAALLADIGRGELSGPLRRLTAQRIFLEPVLGRNDHVRSTVFGGAFLQRTLPPPAVDTLDTVLASLLRSGEVESALLLAARLGDPVRARDALLAVGHPAWLGASGAFDAALAVAERGEPHPLLTELRGDLAYERGQWDDALRLYDEAVRQRSGSTIALARKRAGLLYLDGRLDEADAVCASVTGDCSDDAEEARLLAWRAAIAWARGDATTSERFALPAMELARRSGDDAALAAVYTARAMLAALHGDLAANARYYELALGHAERAGDVAQVVRIRTNRGSLFNEQGQYEPALAELDQAITIAELAGSDTFAALAFNNRGEAHLALGNLDLALADFRRAHDIWTRLASNRILYALTFLGAVQLLRGQRSEAIALLNEAIRIAAAERDAQGLARAYISLAHALDRDDPAGAAEAAQAAIAAGHALWLPLAYVIAGYVALHAGDVAAATEWAAKATELARQRRDRPALAEALLLTASLGTADSAALAQQAGRTWRDLGNPIGQARADLVLARTAVGRRRDELVAGAERTLQDVGAWGALADARRELGEGATSSITIATLGGFRVIRDGEPVDVGEWGSRKARDLVKLLVARRGAPVVRDEVTELLWPDDADRSARRLSVLLSTVRTVFDPGKSYSPDHFVAADHDTVWLVRGHVDIDVEQFLAQAAEGRRMQAAGDRTKARQLLADAAARYLGEFCADDPYADWAAGLRSLAKHTFVDTCFELARIADSIGEHSEAIRYWLRILDVDPYDEDAHLGLIHSLLFQRRHGEARRAYRLYSTKMAELDLEPQPFPT